MACNCLKGLLGPDFPGPGGDWNIRAENSTRNTHVSKVVTWVQLCTVEMGTEHLVPVFRGKSKEKLFLERFNTPVLVQSATNGKLPRGSRNNRGCSYCGNKLFGHRFNDSGRSMIERESRLLDRDG